ncbi:MAG TPA: redoxin domain-containing protein [Ureibacillus sp.]|nr:redoxin domain-containing protein [Ureibacillus sp.]
MKLRSPLPELNGATKWLNGEVKRIDLVGEKPTLIHFWSVSCYLCKEEMGDINRLIHRYNDQLNSIAVHMPRSKEDKDIELISKVAKQFKMNQPIYIDNDLKLTNEFENEYVPTYYIFDKSGVLRHYQVGGGGMRMLEQRVNRVIEFN